MEIDQRNIKSGMNEGGTINFKKINRKRIQRYYSKQIITQHFIKHKQL